MKKFSILFFCLLLLPALCTVCSCGGNPAGVKEITLGSVLPLTGDLASYGQRPKNGIEMAVGEFNAQANGLKIRVVFEDNVGKPKDSANAYQKLVQVNKVPLVFGGGSSPESLAMVPMANRDKVVLLSSVSSSPELARVGGQYFFRICPNDAYQAVILAEWMHERGVKTVSTMFLNNSWGSELAKAFDAKFTSLGGKVVATESCDPGATTFRAQISKMLAPNPEGIFSPTYGKEGGLFLRQLKEAGYSGPVFGGDVWSSPELIETAGNAAEGAYFCAPAQFAGDQFNSFVERYKKRFGSEPDVYAALSYDMANIICQAVQKGCVTGDSFQRYLASMPDYTGVTGSTRFDAHGDVIGKAFSRKVWKEGKAVDVEK